MISLHAHLAWLPLVAALGVALILVAIFAQLLLSERGR